MPRAGFVTIVGAESNEGVLLDRRLVEQMTAAPDSILRSEGRQRWLSRSEQAALRAELVALLELATGRYGDLFGVRSAIDLVDYEMAKGTGVAVVPPAPADT